ncbi:MAG: PIN domain-containing protein [bacterium]|nr:PIN domain-containing protein [bacterium]
MGVVTRAVIDTNVLFEGLTHLGPAADVIDAWVAGEFEPCVSTALALEYHDVLGRKLSPIRGEAALKALQALVARSRHTPIYFRHRPARRDPGDDLVVDCVLNSRSVLVTSNVRDFRTPAREWGFVILRPPDFLRLLAEAKRS